MTRKQAGIARVNKPTRATKRGSLDRYCRPLETVAHDIVKDSFQTGYRITLKGWRKIGTIV